MIYQLSESYFVRSLQESDIDGPYPTWFEDQEICRFNAHGKYTKGNEYFREYVRSINLIDSVVWAICHNDHGHIGNISLQCFSALNRNAEFAIILGDRRHWGKGVAKLAGRQLLLHGFNKLGLNRIYCGTACGNAAMRRLALSLDMREEGRRRDHLFLEGQWMDLIEFGILHHEFNTISK